MVKFNSSQKLKSGVPLGGIGAGKIEILPNGALDFFTFLNNLDNPLTNSKKNKEAKGVLGFHFGLVVKNSRLNFAKLLQTVKIDNYKNIERIDFEGNFPFATLQFIDKELPIKVILHAGSFFIPQDASNSSLPQAAFSFKLENKTDEDVFISLAIMARNIVSYWGVGRKNVVRDEDKFISIDFSSINPLETDTLAGTFSIAAPKSNDREISYLAEFNLQKKAFHFEQNKISLKAWEYLLEFARLPNINSKDCVSSESFQLGAALCVETKIPPGVTKEIPIYFSWYFTNCSEGHFYQNNFKNTDEVIHYVHNKREKLLSASLGWQKKINDCDLPLWLKDALINNLYPFYSSSFWTKTDKFALLEAPCMCSLMGTLDVRFYGSIATALFFPELEIKEMRLFLKAQKQSGYIPHDLGHKRFGMPSCGTTPLLWKDLNPKFMLMVYRDFLWFDRDRKFLEEFYPAAKNALEWILSTDKDGDFLPDNEGCDQTFDLWPFFGASSYVGSIFLASLLAMKEMADIVSDKKTKHTCLEWFKKARENFVKKLWNGRYFICYNNGKIRGEASTVGQLIGQWYAHVLGLDYIVPKELVQKAIRYILSVNARASNFGAINSMLSKQEVDNTCWHSKNIWIGLNYAFASLAIYEGFTKEALSLAENIYQASAVSLNPWNQPDMIDAKTGKYLFGDHYMRNMAIWAIPFALAKENKNVKEMIDYIVHYDKQEF
ncbi:MAG: GH116 family glycosyl hydrolase [Candidatus Omnitrophota bacterium]|nr:GH116 family glycosyl hydrolase [Candidatus Omnitrophota bacterium]